MYPPLYVWTINKSHLPRKKQLRSSIESPTAQDMLRPIPGLISRGDCYLMQKTQSGGWPCPYMAAMKIWTTMLRHSVFVSEMLLQRHTQLRAPKNPSPQPIHEMLLRCHISWDAHTKDESNFKAACWLNTAHFVHQSDPDTITAVVSHNGSDSHSNTYNTTKCFRPKAICKLYTHVHCIVQLKGH